MRDFYRELDEALDELKTQGTYKRLKFNTGAMSGRMPVEGFGKPIVLCSNNYLGLADKPCIIEKAKAALDQYGAGASSVRFICGTFAIHRELEEKTAAFLGMEASLTYTSCWAANTAVIPALLKAGDAVISDELNHASIIDGCRMAGGSVKKSVYSHSDMDALEKCLRETKECGTVLIVTDGVFSMEGDVARLPDICDLARRYGALVLLDDSHSTGVLGPTGRGTMEHYGMKAGVDVITGTYGKALGGAGGGFVAASAPVCDWLIQKSRPHLFSNSLPPVLCAIAMESVAYLEENPGIVVSLKEKTAYCREKIKKLGVDTPEGESAIIPVIIGDTAKAIYLADEMMKKGVFAIGFGFPVVPEGTARVRLQISDALSYEELDMAVEVVKNALTAAG